MEYNILLNEMRKARNRLMFDALYIIYRIIRIHRNII